MIRAAEARIATEMAAVEAADATPRAAAEEEAIRTRKKWQRRNTRTLAREKNRAVCAMAALPLKEKKEDNDSEDRSGDEKI